MDVKYTAGAEALSVSDIGRVVERGEVVTVPDDLGKQLVAQGWEQVPSKTTITPTSKEKN